MGKIAFPGRSDERQAAAHAGDLFLIIDDLILPVAQPPLGRICKGKINIVLVVMLLAQDFNLRFFERFQYRVGSSSLTFTCTSKDSSSAEPPSATSFEKTDCSRCIKKMSILRAYSLAAATSFGFVERQQFPIMHQPFAVDHHVAHVGGLGGID